MARNYNSSLVNSFNKKVFRGGLMSKEDQLRKFYNDNKSRLLPKLQEVAKDKNLNIKPDQFEDYFVENVAYRADLTLNAELERQETYNKLKRRKISITEADKKFKQIRIDNLENISKSDFNKALNESLVMDVYRSWGVDNYMNKWMSIYDPVQKGSKPYGGKYSKAMKQFMQDTGWRGTEEDWLSLEFDEASRIFIYTNIKTVTDEKTKQKQTIITKWKLDLSDSPKEAKYSKI